MTNKEIYEYIHNGGLDSGCWYCKTLKNRILKDGLIELKRFEWFKCATIRHLEHKR